MPYSTVLFDLDSTLYAAACGIPAAFDERMGAYVAHFLGVDATEAQRIRQQYSADLGTTLRGLQMYHDVDVEEYLRFTHELPLDTLLAPDEALDRALGSIRLQKAIFTNAPAEHAERVLAALGIAHHFAHIFDIRFMQFVAKPALQSYHAVLDALGATPAESMFVEDTPRNLEPARQLGMKTILVGAPEEAAPPYVDHSVPDIFAAIDVVLAYQHERSNG